MLPASLHHSPWGAGASLDDRIPLPEYCLRLLDEHVPFGVWICDAAGGVCYVSPAFLEALGMELRQIRSEGWTAALPPEEAGAAVDKWRACLRDRTAWCHEFHIRSRDGKLRHVLGRGAPVMDPEGRVLAWAGVNLDLTEHKRLEDMARREEERRRMTQRLELIGRLAGGVAHDFNNLLTAINGYSEMLIAMPGNQQETVAYAREILKAGEKAAHLTRQLLAFSRRQIFAPRLLDLNRIMNELAVSAAGLLGSNVDVNLEAASARARVKADPAQMEQVMLNLIFNARDAMPQGGALFLRTFDAEVGAPGGLPSGAPEAVPGRYVVLSVRDTGTGMDEDTLEHLFEPFYSTKGRAQGLGLPAVYGIVRQNGGHIAISSRKGEGTEVRIYWPAWEETKPPAAAQAARIAPLVLVAEDDEAVRGLVLRILEENGYTVMTAGSAPEALGLCRSVEGPIDLLLADVVMPGMGGVELAEAVQPLRPTMKILLMSAFLNLHSVRKEVLGSNRAFISKPFTSGDLVAKIQDVLETQMAA
jgi:two-component system cell cycle sensor histidine kinase/response regulator CckA